MVKEYKDVRKSNIGNLGLTTMVKLGGRLKELATDAKTRVSKNMPKEPTRQPRDPDWNPTDFEGSVTRSSRANFDNLLHNGCIYAFI